MLESILIVDDEEDILDIVSTLLEMNGFNSIEAKNADEMYKKIEQHNISLIILDIGLPESDGLTVLKKIRSELDIPVILLTGKGDVIDKVVGFELGADDYITKPFHSHELIARIKTVLRRTKNQQIGNEPSNSLNEIIYFNEWSLDPNSQRVFNPQKQEVVFTSHEFSILLALIISASRALTREQLLDSVGTSRGEYSPYDRSLDVMIAKIRKKLGDNPKKPRFIRTVRQAGYMFIAKVEREQKTSS